MNCEFVTKKEETVATKPKRSKEINLKKGSLEKDCPNETVVGTIYPTPPLGQDMTQGQFLSGV